MCHLKSCLARLSDIQVYFKSGLSVLEFSCKDSFMTTHMFPCANGNGKKFSVYLCFNASGRHTTN